MVRRRPIGAVIAEICRDLGIVPANPLWRELSRAIMANGGNLTALFKGIFKRRCVWITDWLAIALPAPLAEWPPAAPPGTGPPCTRISDYRGVMHGSGPRLVPPC